MDLQLVIRRFIKWDMDGEVPHAARADEVGDIAKALKAFQTDAIKWSEMHKSEQDSQVQLRLAAQQPTEELIHQFRGAECHSESQGSCRPCSRA
jgi:methyl-accepting chemotaxis protein